MGNLEKGANKRQKIPKGQSNMGNLEKVANKRQRIPKGQSNMGNQEKLENQGTHDEDKQIKNTTHHYTC